MMEPYRLKVRVSLATCATCCHIIASEEHTDSRLAANKLSSEQIPKNQFKSTEEVLIEYSCLAQYPCKMTTLSVKLAREAFFGDTIMAKCTPRGWQDMPALPPQELSDLKMLMFKTYPTFWTTPEVYI